MQGLFLLIGGIALAVIAGFFTTLGVLLALSFPGWFHSIRHTQDAQDGSEYEPAMQETIEVRACGRDLSKTNLDEDYRREW